MAASPTSAGAGSSTAGRISSGYSVESEWFVVGGGRWDIELYPSCEKEDDDTGYLAIFLHNYADEDQDEDEVLKV